HPVDADVAGELGATRGPLERRRRRKVAAHDLALELVERDLSGRERHLDPRVLDAHAERERKGAEGDAELAFDAVERGKVERRLRPNGLTRGERLGTRRGGRRLLVLLLLLLLRGRG